ncbi:MAG: GAF domain-containing protein, partial [Deltaproteobacteria bacterium]
LERDLIDKDSIVSQTGFLRLQERLRTLFHSSSLVAGVAAIQDERVLLLSTGREITHNCIFGDSHHAPKSYFEGSVFYRSVMEDSIMIVRDLTDEPSPAPADEELIRDGYRSILVAPLKYQDEPLGTLILKSPIPGEFGPTTVMLAEQIVPLFSMALKRALDELNSNVQRVIKEKCTAVHPSVEWRFQQVVYDHLETLHKGEASDLEAIVFRDVYPLYAASDIRGSSDERNNSIQADLSDHLRLALDIVSSASEARSLPILHELGHRIGGEARRIESGVSSGDDMSVIRFLRGELEPVFPILREFGPRVAEAIQAYEGALEPMMGTVYRKRKVFEESVSRFNERLSGYLDREEAEAQAVFPHYFDKHQTDGIDYLIYLGASMVENGEFDPLYVRNMRLWQLMVACGIAWHAEQLKSVLQVPLDVTHLILVHNTPLSIRFRFDEKRFDVDGAYDVAHEIVRSRIDKAMVRGGKERLTQPEKIAIVYSRPEEAREMIRHIDFLRTEGYLRGDVESLELENLQGVQGLKALRVAVNLESTALARRAQGPDTL